MRKLLVTTSLLVLAACQTVQPIKTTASGRPEAVFAGETSESVSNKIAAGCMSKGLLIKESSSSMVVCGKTMEGGEAVLAQMLVGNSYSTTPEKSIRFNIVSYDGSVRVAAYQWFESQMAFGQVNRQELNSGNHFNDVQNFLYSLGGK